MVRYRKFNELRKAITEARDKIAVQYMRDANFSFGAHLFYGKLSDKMSVPKMHSKIIDILQEIAVEYETWKLGKTMIISGSYYSSTTGWHNEGMRPGGAYVQIAGERFPSDQVVQSLPNSIGILGVGPPENGLCKMPLSQPGYVIYYDGSQVVVKGKAWGYAGLQEAWGTGKVLFAELPYDMITTIPRVEEHRLS
jgi:hypothetical protein